MELAWGEEGRVGWGLCVHWFVCLFFAPSVKRSLSAAPPAEPRPPPCQPKSGTLLWAPGCRGATARKDMQGKGRTRPHPFSASFLERKAESLLRGGRGARRALRKGRWPWMKGGDSVLPA